MSAAHTTWRTGRLRYMSGARMASTPGAYAAKIEKVTLLPTPWSWHVFYAKKQPDCIYPTRLHPHLMALVAYSDSDSDSDDSQNFSTSRPAKKIRPNTPPTGKQASSLPPLPTAFHDLYASSTRVSVKDDPSLHGGRKRVIPHVEGNWPTHIFLECKCFVRFLPSS